MNTLLLFVALALAPAPSLSRPQTGPDPTLVLSDGCEGAGFRGTLFDSTSSITFEACTTATGTHAVTRDSRGRALVEVTVDPRAGTLAVLVGGTPLGDSATQDQLDAMRAHLSTPDAALASEQLWHTLTSAGGKDPSSPEMAAIAVQLVAFEQLVPARHGHDCLGCCGTACYGCTGCYTQGCLAHDLCVRVLGPGDGRCSNLFSLAAISAWCCRGLDLGPLC